MKKPVFQIFDADPESFSGEVMVLVLEQDKWQDDTMYSRTLIDAISHVADCGDLFAKPGQQVWLYPAMMDWKEEQPFQARRILLLAIDAAEASRDSLQEKLRLCAGSIAQEVRRIGGGDALILLPWQLPLTPDNTACSLVEGLVLGSYAFNGYKREQVAGDAKQERDLRYYIHAASTAVKEVQRAMKQAQIMSQAVCVARDMGNQPANHWTPADFATHAEKIGKKKKLQTTVLGKSEMQDLGMEAILAVNRGSALPPSLSVIEYRTAKKYPTVLLVGKGLTFDSGGISAKPPAGMEEMKFDMCGGAAVMAVMQALAELGTSGVNVVGLVPATENLSGSAAIKPGDVVRHYGGLNAEVVNTDAEGRLILGDAIAYGIASYAPDAVIDIATLTGAAVVGLGHHYSCLLANDDRLATRLLKAGEETGEPLWRLPLGPEYRKQLDSTVADIKNAGDRSAGTITAACYLQEFVGTTPWAHLDIAGTAYNFTEKSYVPKGASGAGVRTLLRALIGWEKLSGA